MINLPQVKVWRGKAWEWMFLFDGTLPAAEGIFKRVLMYLR